MTFRLKYPKKFKVDNERLNSLRLIRDERNAARPRETELP